MEYRLTEDMGMGTEDGGMETEVLWMEIDVGINEIEIRYGLTEANLNFIEGYIMLTVAVINGEEIGIRWGKGGVGDVVPHPKSLSTGEGLAFAMWFMR